MTPEAAQLRLDQVLLMLQNYVLPPNPVYELELLDERSTLEDFLFAHPGLGVTMPPSNVADILYVTTIAALKAQHAGIRAFIYAGGYYAPGDGGGGIFFWDATSALADNGGTVIRPTSAPTLGRWIRPAQAAYNVRTFGARCDAVTDDAARVNAALATVDYAFIAPRDTCLIGAPVAVPDFKRFGGYGYNSVLKKGFNGDMLTLGVRTEIDHLRFDGAGGAFTGRGIAIATGAGGDGIQNIHDNWILDTASHCIEFTATGAGWGARIVNNKMDTFGYATHAVRFPSPDVNGPRLMAFNHSVGPAVDLGDSAGVVIVGNMCGEGPQGGPYTVPSVVVGPAAFKALVCANAFETSVPIVILGIDSSWIGNEFNGGYSIGAGATFIKAGFSATTAGVALLGVDNSGNDSNEIWENLNLYTPVWSGGSPSLGNGTIVGAYQRKGRTVSVQIHLTMGSTTTFGAGAWVFSMPPGLPALGSGTSIGAALLFDATGSVYPATALVQSSGILIYPGGSASAVTPTVPFTWAAGDQLFIGADFTL